MAKAGRPVGTGYWRKYKVIHKPLNISAEEKQSLFDTQAKDKYNLLTCDYVVGVGAIFTFEKRHPNE